MPPPTGFMLGWLAQASTYEPKTWMGVLGLLIIAMIVIAPVAIPAWITVHRQRKIGGDVTAVKDQVQNGHPRTAPALRDQVDTSIQQNCDMLEKLCDVLERQAEVSEQVGHLTGTVAGFKDTVEVFRDELKAQQVRIARLEHPDRRGW